MTERYAIRTIGLDYHDVVVDFARALINYFNKLPRNERNIRTLSLEDMTSFNLQAVLGFQNYDDFQTFMMKFNKAVRPNHYKFVNGAKNGIISLKENGHGLHLVTNAPLCDYDSIKERLERTFPLMFDDYLFTSALPTSLSPGSKVQICQLAGINLIIDDKPDHIIACADSGINCLIFDRPWNKSFSSRNPLVERVNSWPEIVSHPWLRSRPK
jgi:hypothetical protein